ncbi:MAG: hypothetical protein IJS99_05400 [Synergistaceae bacterium]|nr:hypothetical protein [Synergistaceae bacterium]
MEFCKLEIFIPESHLEILQQVLRDSDAGHIGNYDSCLSYSHVISTWRPLENTSPYIGEANILSTESEIKVEVTCKIKDLDSIIQAVKKIHPYEEPVINVIPLLRISL